ncbi:MAG: type II toxin-antitoxin system RelE/ParE family toxin [Lactobacillales bacterium]|jgi:plasmid stabilization system protein ParE|nr:type II toxin-antitoxin system RelE/ParE family toxin [Lactobacillales bacterium]
MSGKVLLEESAVNDLILIRSFLVNRGMAKKKVDEMVELIVRKAVFQLSHFPFSGVSFQEKYHQSLLEPIREYFINPYYFYYLIENNKNVFIIRIRHFKQKILNQF